MDAEKGALDLPISSQSQHLSRRRVSKLRSKAKVPAGGDGGPKPIIVRPSPSLALFSTGASNTGLPSKDRLKPGESKQQVSKISKQKTKAPPSTAIATATTPTSSGSPGATAPSPLNKPASQAPTKVSYSDPTERHHSHIGSVHEVKEVSSATKQRASVMALRGSLHGSLQGGKSHTKKTILKFIVGGDESREEDVKAPAEMPTTATEEEDKENEEGATGPRRSQGQGEQHRSSDTGNSDHTITTESDNDLPSQKSATVNISFKIETDDGGRSRGSEGAGNQEVQKDSVGRRAGGSLLEDYVNVTRKSMRKSQGFVLQGDGLMMIQTDEARANLSRDHFHDVQITTLGELVQAKHDRRVRMDAFCLGRSLLSPTMFSVEPALPRKTPIRQENVEGYKEFWERIVEIVEETNGNRSNEQIVCVFTADFVRNKKTWSEDCNLLESAINFLLSYMFPTGYLLWVRCGSQKEWKDPNNPFRKDNSLMIATLPTIKDWNTEKRLAGNRLFRMENLATMLED